MNAKEFTYSGPYTHENLTVFLIHGTDTILGKNFITLEEALAQKKVVIHETGNVGQLEIENVSDEEVYIQSGDIVKGGRQDRTIRFDFIAPPKSGRLPIMSFCVEAHRWGRRGAEEASHFTTTASHLSSKKIKLAAKMKVSQAEVWSSVHEAQSNLMASIATEEAAGRDDVSASEVVAAASPTSYQLTLESKSVQKLSEEYTTKLAPIVEGKSDVVGFAFAVNGRLNSADVYASNALFKKLWAKLLRASAIEAMMERTRDKKFTAPDMDTLKTSLGDAETGAPHEQNVADRIKTVVRETDRNLMFETLDKSGVSVHKNYVTK
jgi:hypothetical protein